MSKQTIQTALRNGSVFPRIVPGVPFGNGVFAHTQATNDSVRFRVNVVQATDSPLIRISFYRYVNGIVSTLSSVRITDWRAEINQAFVTGDYFVEVESNCTLEVMAVPLNFVPIKTLGFDCYHDVRVSMNLTMKRRPQVCNEALQYELIEGELPPGIRLHKDGLLHGIVDELDCIDDSMSPSFNWYYDNHDGVAQSWGRKWRFKVRVSIATQPDVFTDEWLCLRVFNNWSVNREAFKESKETVYYDHKANVVLPTMPALCDVEPEKPFVPERHVTELPRYGRGLDCVPCNDPTTPHKVEEYRIPAGLRIRTPDELIRYYVENQNNFEPLVMNLHNSILFKELLAQIGKESPRTVFELKITDDTITIKKFWLDNGSALNDVDATMIANRTITGQVNPIEIVSYGGEMLEGVLTW